MYEEYRSIHESLLSKPTIIARLPMAYLLLSQQCVCGELSAR